MKRFIALATVAVCALTAVPGSAATIFKTVTIDLNAPGVSKTTGSITASGATFAPITIHDGDTLDYTILFAGTESITVSDADSFSAKIRAVSGTSLANISQTGTLTLLGTGYTSDPNTVTTSSSDTVGESIDAEAKFSTLPGTVTFTGMHYVGTVDFADDLARSYNLPSLAVAADSVSVNGTASVPEPATWAMMLIGFGGVGGMLRSRRTTKVKFA